MPGFWLHTSSTGILCRKQREGKTYCETPAQSAYDDLEYVPHLASLSDSASHRDVDKIILAVGSDAVKTAIICPKQAMVKVVVLETREVDKYKTFLV
jgi:hypothetical protein